MKKIILILLFATLPTVIYAQKKKPVAKSSASTSSTLAKADNITAELVKGNFYISIAGTPKDTMQLRKVADKVTVSDCKLTAFKASGTSLYLVSWSEKSMVKTDLKTEEITEIHATIFDVSTKNKALQNIQKTTKITEKVFLDKLKTASETQEKMRREGFEFNLNPDGSVTLKNKGRDTKMVYNATEKKYK